MECSICSAKSELFARGSVLGRYEATYMRCLECGFLQVKDPTWLDEAYSSAVADVDIGGINRIYEYSKVTKIVLHSFLNPTGRYLDYGAGYGGFVRRMRDMGYNFYWFDKHCENIFAKEFCSDLTSKYEMLTAFEVMEHLSDPLREFKAFAASADNILFSTSLIGQSPPPLADWSYYAPETGQHIAFYTVKSLQVIAKKLGMFFSTDGKDLHLLSKSPVSNLLFRAVISQKLNRWLEMLYQRPSLLSSDFHRGREAALKKL